MQAQSPVLCVWSRACTGSLPLPEAGPGGKRRVAGRVLARVSGATRRFVGKRTRHSLSVRADCFIGSDGKEGLRKHRRQLEG